MTGAASEATAEGRSIRPSARTVVGLAVVALVVLFIAVNRDETEISFVVYETDTALWIALTVAAVGGLLAGFLIGRRRYRR
jgi:uncharacterized integral membrane protein